MTAHIYVERFDIEIEVTIEADYTPRVPCTYNHPSEDERIDINATYATLSTFDIELTAREKEQAEEAIREAANAEWEAQELEHESP